MSVVDGGRAGDGSAGNPPESESVVCPLVTSADGAALESDVHAPPYGPAPSPAALAPLLDHLAADLPVSDRRTFPVGTVQPDGRLDLCKQALGPDGCRRITAALKGNTVIRSLLLGTDGIGDTGAADVAELIESNPNVQTVYLGCNLIGESGARRLTRALSANRTVTGLWLKRNPLGSSGAEALAAMMRQNNTIRVLDVVDTRPGDLGLRHLIAALTERNRTAERLYLGGNQIGPVLAPALAGLVRGPSPLRALFLNVGCLGDDGAALLAPALEENRLLEELGLGSNGMTDSGVACIAEALAQHPALLHLDLAHAASARPLGAACNQIGFAAVRALARLIEQTRSLQFLDLRGAPIDEDLTLLLVKALERNRSLLRLEMNGPQDPRLTALLDRNRRLHPTGGPHRSQHAQAIRSVYR